jgi:hypothetical protein
MPARDRWKSPTGRTSIAAFLVAATLRRLRENSSLGIAGALPDAQLAVLDAGKGLPAEIAHRSSGRRSR